MSATVIDELIVKLGINTTEFKRGAREVDSGFKELAASAAKLFTLLAGGKGLTEFAKNMVEAQAALGMFSKNIGIASETITTWGNAVVSFGGSADALKGTFATLAKAQQDYAISGQSALVPYLTQLKVGFGDADTMLLNLADSVQKMDRATANNLLGNIGIDQGTINMMLEGREAIQLVLDKQKSLNLVNKASTERAQKLKNSWTELQQKGESLGRDLFAKLMPHIETLLGWFKSISDWSTQHKDFVVGTITAIAGALTVSLLPALVALSATPFVRVAALIVGLGAAIGGLYDDYKVWQDGGESLINWETWDSQIKQAKEGFSRLKGYIQEHGGVFQAMKDKTHELIDKTSWEDALNDAERIFNALIQLNQDYGFSINALSNDWDEFKQMFKSLLDWKPFGEFGKSIGEYIEKAFGGVGDSLKSGLSSTADFLENKADEGAEAIKPKKEGLSKREQEEMDMVNKPSPYDDLFAAAEKKYKLPKNSLKLTAAGESNMNPNAVDDNGESQDYGLMQHNSKYLADRKLTKESAMNPASAIEASGKFMADLLKRNNGDVAKMFERYNGSGTRARNYSSTRMRVMSALNGNELDNKPKMSADYKGIRVKSNESVAGGKAHQGTIDFAKVLQSKHDKDIKYFSAFNDKYHQENSPNSGHTKGLKFDVALNDPRKAEAMKKNIEDLAKAAGVQVKVLNEYAQLSKNGTGGHLDVGFKNEQEAAKFSEAVYKKTINTEEQNIFAANRTENNQYVNNKRVNNESINNRQASNNEYVNNKRTTNNESVINRREQNTFASNRTEKNESITNRRENNIYDRQPPNLIVASTRPSVSSVANNQTKNINTQSDVKINTITVNTQATDAKGIARDMRHAVQHNPIIQANGAMS